MGISFSYPTILTAKETLDVGLIESIESNIWLLCSMQLTMLDHGIDQQTLHKDSLDNSIIELDSKISAYIQSVTEKYLTSKDYDNISSKLEGIIKFANIQKYSYRTLIEAVKDMLAYVTNLIDSCLGKYLDSIMSEVDIKGLCLRHSDGLLKRYRQDLQASQYPSNQINIRLYNLHKLLYDQQMKLIDKYMRDVVDQVKSAILIESDQLLCAAITSDIFLGQPGSVKKAKVVIDRLMELYDEGKNKLLEIPFPSIKRNLEEAVEEISYKIDTIVRQIQVAYASDKNSLQHIAVFEPPAKKSKSITVSPPRKALKAPSTTSKSSMKKDTEAVSSKEDIESNQVDNSKAVSTKKKGKRKSMAYNESNDATPHKRRVTMNTQKSDD